MRDSRGQGLRKVKGGKIHDEINKIKAKRRYLRLPSAEIAYYQEERDKERGYDRKIEIYSATRNSFNVSVRAIAQIATRIRSFWREKWRARARAKHRQRAACSCDRELSLRRRMELQECNLHRGTDSANASLIKTSLYALPSRALGAKAERFEIREVEKCSTRVSRECESAIRTLSRRILKNFGA